MNLKTVNLTLDTITIADIENHKIVPEEKLRKDLRKLMEIDANINKYSSIGNPFLYHFQLKNLLKCRRGDKKSIYDLYADTKLWEKMISDTKKRNRGGQSAAANVFECYRINLGSVVMFKSVTAKHIYKKYGATSVLDPTSGWGGRMLGAWALRIDYTGIDTNIEMKPAYDEMIDFLDAESNPFFDSEYKLKMIWESCLDVDFSKIDYDFVLTSPPYINMEIYEHMPKWSNDELFYREFLNPLIEKCKTHIKKGGYVCFNISPKMYTDALKYGLIPCDIEEDLPQNLGQKTGKKAPDKIYIWRC